MPKQLEKVYDPKQVEDKTYRFWEEARRTSPASCIWDMPSTRRSRTS